MRKHTILFSLALLSGLSAHADGNPFKAVQPVGALSKGTSITLSAGDSKTTYFNTSTTAASSTGFQNIDSNTVYKVETASNPNGNGENKELEGLVTRKTVVMQKSDFAASDSNCLTTYSCTLKNDTPVYQTGSFNFFDWLKDIFGFGETKSLVTPTQKYSPDVSGKLVAKGLDSTNVENRFLSKVGGAESCDMPDDIKNNARFQCGLRMAQDAYQKAKSQGKVTSDTFIFNDFSSGDKQGKMYFFNSSGGLVNVVEKNPIMVIGGVGGFGNEPGKNGTPPGAIVTQPYKYPSPGTIRDAVYLEGLESSNANLAKRLIRLHGWDPYVNGPQDGTAGCLGVDGNLELGGQLGRMSKGNYPAPHTPYLDMMKERLLKGNKVMIYNFTPNKVREGLCR